MLKTNIEYRPWGCYEVTKKSSDGSELEKLITIKPNNKLSLQSHKHREEFYVILEGNALVEIDSVTYTLTSGDEINIPIGAIHRVSNIGQKDLVIHEIQRGELLSEEDIIRYEDDYGRVDYKEVLIEMFKKYPNHCEFGEKLSILINNL
jgi:mannose-6-phosphate isomerase-like protein (cupin superfamily)|tara:strand:- start:121 stop:567 length:447 start_codon:yes stop_codon:yes gene_type:complete